MAKIINADGTTKEATPTNGTNFKLEEVQKIVGGLVEVVSLKSGDIMIINEEGKLIGLPRNEEATKLAGLPSVVDRWKAKLIMQEMGVTVIDTMGDEEDYIAGNVLVCKDDEFR